MKSQTSLTNLLDSNIDWGIVVLKDEFTDQQIWEAIQKSDKKQTAFVIDLRVFPRETVNQLFARLDRQFGPREGKSFRNVINKI